MPSIEQRLRLVHRLGDTAAAVALADALDHAESDECPAIAAALVERPCDAVFGSLIRRWGDLDEPVRRRVVAAARRSPSRVVTAASSGPVRQRRWAVEMIARLGLLQGVDAAVECLTNTDRDVAAAAAEALDRIVEAHLCQAGEPAARRADDPAAYRAEDSAARRADDQRLDQALAAALDAYPRHRQTTVLIAAARVLQTPGPAVRRWLDDRDHPTHLALRGFMKRLPDEQLAPMLLTWLGIDALGAQALEHIARLALTPHVGAMLRGRTHLLALPRQRARLKRLDTRHPAAPPTDVALDLDDDAQSALTAWIMAVPMSGEQRLVCLADGVSFRSPRARLATLRALAALAEPRSDAIIARLCFDEDARLARLAAMHCIRRRIADLPELLRRLLRSPHRSIRALAAAHSNAVDFESVWSHWSGSGPRVEQRLAARLKARDEPQTFVAEIRRRLAGQQRETSLRAMRLASDLHLLGEVELELLTLTRSGDVRTAATAVKCLGLIDSDSARSAVAAALRHADVRTRANAIEVLSDRLIEAHRGELEAIARCHDNRPRANAIAAIARVDRPAAAAQLEVMLGDARPLHRLSALWAADAMMLTQCASRVADLAAGDRSPPVRTRARRTARRLLAAMTTRPSPGRVEHWSEPASPARTATSGEPASPERMDTSGKPASAARVETAPLANNPSIKEIQPPAPPARADGGALSRLALLPLGPLSLAQSSDRLNAISDSFIHRDAAWPALGGAWLAPALAACGLIGATVMALRWSVNDARRFGPAYRSLAAGLKLTRRERRLLNAVALRCARTNAAGLLISRGCFDHHISQWRQIAARPSDPRSDVLAALRGKLFA